MKIWHFLSFMIVCSLASCGQKSSFSGDSKQNPPSDNSNKNPDGSDKNTPGGGGDKNNPNGGGDNGGGDTSTPTAPPPQCKNQDNLKAAHFLFLVDNSNSQKQNDCPRALINDCGRTERERAVLSAFDTLVYLAKMPGNVANSTISVTRFTPSSESEDGPPTEMLAPTAIGSSNRFRVERSLRFTRNPSGGTPFSGVVQGGQKWASQLASDGIPRVAVIMTDGEPTDIDPNAVLNQANALKGASNVRFITVKITKGFTVDQRVAEHRSIMNTIYQQRANAGVKSPFNSFESYFDALITLPGKISEIMTVDQAPGLTEKIGKEIIQKETKCI